MTAPRILSDSGWTESGVKDLAVQFIVDSGQDFDVVAFANALLARPMKKLLVENEVLKHNLGAANEMTQDLYSDPSPWRVEAAAMAYHEEWRKSGPQYPNTDWNDFAETSLKIRRNCMRAALLAAAKA